MSSADIARSPTREGRGRRGRILEELHRQPRRGYIDQFYIRTDHASHLFDRGRRRAPGFSDFKTKAIMHERGHRSHISNGETDM